LNKFNRLGAFHEVVGLWSRAVSKLQSYGRRRNRDYVHPV
jgi:hypothetical protein